MRAKVSILYRDGIPIPMRGKFVTVEADVDVAPGRHPATGRYSMTASTSEDVTSTTAYVRPLHDVALVWIAAKGIRLRGLEVVASGREVAQEWFLEPLPDATCSQKTVQPK